MNPGKLSLVVPEVYRDARPGEPVFFDDGRITGIVEKTSARQLQIRITHTSRPVEHLASDRGVNFPETELNLPTLDAKDLQDLYSILVALPAVSIDHLGLSTAGLPTLLALAEKGIRVKASGFGRVDFDVPTALKDLYAANPDSLMFGTDLPSTRAARPYTDRDFQLLIDTLGEKAAGQIFYTNAINFYRVRD